MHRRQKDIDAENRQMEALAERWELRLHAIALTLTAVVLTMRLVTGRQDLTSDDYYWDTTNQEQPAGEVLGSASAEPRAQSASEPRAGSDERSPGADTSAEPARASHVGTP